jgi:hypothetical protein
VNTKTWSNARSDAAYVTVRGRALANALIIMLVLLGQVACERKMQVAQLVTLRDSAGVVIFQAPADGRAQGTWTLRNPLEVVIAEAQGAESLDQVRAGRLFMDGSFVIANEGSHELLFYSVDGLRERSVGRSGSGPMEFRSFDFLEVIADSVWVGDWQNQRVSVLDHAGEFVRLVPLNAAIGKGLVHGVGVFNDGSTLLSLTEPATIAPGLSPNFRRLVVLHVDGSISDLGQVFQGESYSVTLEGAIADIGRPFAREGLTSVHGGDWFYSGGKEYRIERYDMKGRLHGVYTYPGDPGVVTQHDLDEYFVQIRIKRGEAREQLLRRAPPPERLPSYAALLIDRKGNVWAAPHEGAKPRNCWHVYQRWPPQFVKACFPDDYTVLDVTGTFVLGVLHDEYDVKKIARYRLAR